jgi:hypothetical protein
VEIDKTINNPKKKRIKERNDGVDKADGQSSFNNDSNKLKERWASQL